MTEELIQKLKSKINEKFEIKMKLLWNCVKHC